MVFTLGPPGQVDIARRRVLRVFHAHHVGDLDALGQVRRLRDEMDALKVALGRGNELVGRMRSLARFLQGLSCQLGHVSAPGHTWLFWRGNHR